MMMPDHDGKADGKGEGEGRAHFPMIGYGRGALAPYASDPAGTRGRAVQEPESPTRTAYQRDRDRIIHSTAFRRLKHKTQVFIFHEGDHYRTRLTHTIEVAQLARSIARALRLDEDLAEALALAHDLGHTPFGHAGEDALQRCMALYGGFEHNGQTLRIVTELERRYAAFDGLNLTFETLEGIVKHNGPLTDPAGNSIGKYAHTGLPHAIRNHARKRDLLLSTHASLEAQTAAIADDIAYNAHDIDDGLRAGSFGLDDLADVPLVGELLVEVRERYPALDKSRTTHELVRRLISLLVEDVILTAHSNLTALQPVSADAIRHAGRTLVTFSPAILAADRGIKAFLMEHMYRTPAILLIRNNAEAIVADLFHRYCAQPGEMTVEWRAEAEEAAAITRAETGGGADLARLVCDYVAGMTDRFAVQEHRRLFDVTPVLR